MFCEVDLLPFSSRDVERKYIMSSTRVASEQIIFVLTNKFCLSLLWLVRTMMNLFDGMWPVMFSLAQLKKKKSGRSKQNETLSANNLMPTAHRRHSHCSPSEK